MEKMINNALIGLSPNLRKIFIIGSVVSIFLVIFSVCVPETSFASVEGTISDNRNNFGKYIGSVKTEWLEDGRKMRLLESIEYIDPKGIEWIAPAGFVTDGASIPQIFWSLPDVGGPYEGKYRVAAVIHDAACSQKNRPWDSVQEAFFYAMLASGVDLEKALGFYAAVLIGCRRWSIGYERVIARSGLEDAISKIRSETKYSSVSIVSKKSLEGQPDMVELSLVVSPFGQILRESDFPKLKDYIREMVGSVRGAISAEQIREFLEKIRTYQPR